MNVTWVVVIPQSTTFIILPSLHPIILSCMEVLDETEVLRPDISSEEGMWPFAGLNAPPFGVLFDEYFPPSCFLGNYWPYWHAMSKNYIELSITLIWGSMSPLNTISCFWYCLGPLMPSDLWFTSSYADVNSTQMGLDVIHSPDFTLHCYNPNSVSSAVSTPYSNVVLHDCRNTFTCLLIRLINYAPNNSFAVKTLSYCNL